ncbi:hypothetical protein [Nostoc sp. FACHB-280]|uniref:hypothetical protein n=1 Tax=Nostoc sp. FACHB-280 TaxID=2692839 RepID=UPI00168AB50E|nr:hypothetical protein [Nostoc sp. FACHB-280]MBD2497477.1 hypothetical protein [Nostoc sp. FACHB-280]
MATQLSAAKSPTDMVISWEALPNDYHLDDKPVENTNQPILAGALRESLEISGFIQSQMLIASNFGLCATVNGQLILKAPDWVYVPAVNQVISDRKSYTPNLDGEVPAIVMEFLSDIEQERQRAEQECQQKERLMAYLASQGIDPNNLPPLK